MKNYVVGFAFDKEFEHVALIEKLKPDFQKGKFNGIGGHIEGRETLQAAMKREFQEEAGLLTGLFSWKKFCVLKGNNNDGSEFQCYVFATILDLSKLKTVTEEKIGIFKVENVVCERLPLLANVRWLVPMAIDCLKNSYCPKFVEVIY